MTQILVTVGSTKFPQLFPQLFQLETLSILHDLLSIDRCVIQYGNMKFEELREILTGVQGATVRDDDDDETESFHYQWTWNKRRFSLYFQCFAFRPNLTAEYELADFVISHAGSGTMLEVLRLGKPLIVVVNDQLMDNHQWELAQAFYENGYLLMAIERPGKLLEKLLESRSDLKRALLTLKQYPNVDLSLFRSLADQLMT